MRGKEREMCTAFFREEIFSFATNSLPGVMLVLQNESQFYLWGLPIGRLRITERERIDKFFRP